MAEKSISVYKVGSDKIQVLSYSKDNRSGTRIVDDKKPERKMNMTDLLLRRSQEDFISKDTKTYVEMGAADAEIDIRPYDGPSVVQRKFLNHGANAQIARVILSRSSYQIWNERFVNQMNKALDIETRYTDFKDDPLCDMCRWCGGLYLNGSETYGQERGKICPICSAIYKRAGTQASSTGKAIIQILVKLGLACEIDKKTYKLMLADYNRKMMDFDDYPYRLCKHGPRYFYIDCEEVLKRDHPILYSKQYFRQIVGAKTVELAEYYWKMANAGYQSYERMIFIKLIYDMLE